MAPISGIIWSLRVWDDIRALRRLPLRQLDERMKCLCEPLDPAQKIGGAEGGMIVWRLTLDELSLLRC